MLSTHESLLRPKALAISCEDATERQRGRGLVCCIGLLCRTEPIRVHEQTGVHVVSDI